MPPAASKIEQEQESSSISPTQVAGAPLVVNVTKEGKTSSEGQSPSFSTALPLQDGSFPADASTENIDSVDAAMKQTQLRLQRAAQDHPEAFYLRERILTCELAEEASNLLQSNAHMERLPVESEGKVLTRLMEAYYVGQGDVASNGKHLPSFYHSLRPFWSLTTVHGCSTGESTGKQFSKLSGRKSSEIFEKVRDIFEEEATDGLVFFRAFCYAQHRLDYHQGQVESKEEGGRLSDHLSDNDDDLLDAYCVIFYSLKALQGKLFDFYGWEFDPIIDETFKKYRSDDVEMNFDDLLWCFCILFLRIGTDLRRCQGIEGFHQLFTKPFDVTMQEELAIAQLAIELRPESPVNYLSAYRMVMEFKPIVEEPYRDEWIHCAYEFAMQGLAGANQWGDPFFQYTFEMIGAYWLPTSAHVPNKYTISEIQERMQRAYHYRKECVQVVPEFMFWIARQHEMLLLKRIIVPFGPTLEKNQVLTKCLVDAFTYYGTPSIAPPNNPNLWKNEKESTANDTICAFCSKTTPSDRKCTRCGLVPYCSKKCQISHWQGGHRKECQAEMLTVRNTCDYCTKSLQKTLKCSKCNIATYCNRTCQVAHWKSGHKQICKTITNIGETNAIAFA